MEPLRAAIIGNDPRCNPLLVEFLKKYRIETTCFVNPNEALNQALRHRPDVVFLDVACPGRGGIELLERFGRTPALADVPVVITSSSGTRDEVVKAIRGGAVAYLIKPFHEDNLLRKLAQALIYDIDDLRKRAA